MAGWQRRTSVLIHGMGFGALFLLAFAGGPAGLYSLRPELLTVGGMRERLVRLTAGTWLMAIAGWGTWKGHIAWFAPILATVVAFVVWRYGAKLAEYPFLRKVLIVTFVLAFGAAAVAGLFGALITKAAPIHRSSLVHRRNREATSADVY